MCSFCGRITNEATVLHVSSKPFEVSGKKTNLIKCKAFLEEGKTEQGNKEIPSAPPLTKEGKEDQGKILGGKPKVCAEKRTKPRIGVRLLRSIPLSAAHRHCTVMQLPCAN